MRDRYLEVTYRKGKPLAAYLYLPHKAGVNSVRTERDSAGLLVDYDDQGRPIGIEVTSPATLTLQQLNAVLSHLNLPPVTSEELAPLHAA